MLARDGDPRVALGQLLRQAREEARLTQDAIAHAIGVDRSGVARIEAGDRGVTLATLEAWLRRCDVSGLAASAIRVAWLPAQRREDPRAAASAPWFALERRAHTLRFWQPIVVPGIAQCEKYAQELIRVGTRDPEKIAEAVADRMARHDVLDRDDPPTVVLVLWQPVLYHQIGTAQVMAAQCGHLLDLSDHPSVLLHILPSALGANFGLGGAVSLASVPGEPDAMLVSSLLEDGSSLDPAQVKAASATFERVRGVSANTIESRNLTTEARDHWQSRTR